MAIINGGDGGNTLIGTAGDDVIYGHSVADTLSNVGQIVATQVATGFSSPVFATSAPGDPDRLYVVEKESGQVMLLDPSTGSRSTFLSIPTNQIMTSGEQGLLSVAFHPDYQNNGRFFVNLVNANGDVEVRSYTRSAQNPDVADPTGTTVITVSHPTFTNHNGGTVVFGPDGYLYVSIGDGGGTGDPFENAQNTGSLLGKILRLDVDPGRDDFPADATRNYGIPATNPFVGQPGADEVWAYGLRNPWRISFDSETGDLYIGDVGQGAREEIDFQPASSTGGLDFGWDTREGTLSYEGPDSPSFVGPIFDYAHTLGRSVTGGYVYHGPAAGMQGLYIFADFLSNRVWSLRVENGQAIDVIERTSQIVTGGVPLSQIASFGVDGDGTLYVISLAGNIYRLEPTAAAGDGSDTISGGNGNDAIAGGIGNDVIDGGSGHDVAVYSIASSSASWARNGNGSWTVTAGAAGSDTLTGIEILRFADRDFLLQQAFVGDFSGDGRSDILWRNAGTGEVWEYQMNGTTVTDSALVATLGPSWQIDAVGDFNGDERCDILWRNRDTGEVWEYQLNGATVINAAPVATVGLEWRVEGTADFNSDGRADILWRNAITGQVWQYQMNGTTISNSALVATVVLEWQIAGIGDFNADGRGDILWRNMRTGEVREYQLNGATVVNNASVAMVGLDWQIAGIGDFNGDSRSDILWRNINTGQVWEYQLDGATIINSASVATVGLDWQIAGVGDFNGDTRSDILWRNVNTGQVWEYQLNGTTITHSGAVAVLGLDWQQPPGDSAQAGASDFGGDGYADILWRNTNTGQVFEYQMNGTTIASSGSVAAVALSWRIDGVGDFNGDRHGDILWRNTTTGEVRQYQLNGTTVMTNGSVAQVGLDWQIAGIGDFNADGHADILWRNVTSGQVWEYQMNGTTIVNSALVANVGLDWRIEGVADFNGDGRSDILWRNTSTGQVREYQMNGTTIVNNGAVAVVGLDWRIDGVGDINADGHSDILWRNTNTGQVWAYQMNGTSITFSGNVATVGLDWHIEGLGDFNGDGRSDILWRNLNTGEILEYQMNGTAIVGGGSIATVGLEWQVFL